MYRLYGAIYHLGFLETMIWCRLRDINTAVSTVWVLCVYVWKAFLSQLEHPLFKVSTSRASNSFNPSTRMTRIITLHHWAHIYRKGSLGCVNFAMSGECLVGRVFFFSSSLLQPSASRHPINSNFLFTFIYSLIHSVNLLLSRIIATMKLSKRFLGTPILFVQCWLALPLYVCFLCVSQWRTLMTTLRPTRWDFLLSLLLSLLPSPLKTPLSWSSMPSKSACHRLLMQAWE